MSRTSKILAWTGGIAAVVIALVLIALFTVPRTAWFQNFVREKIVSSIESSTGGRGEVKGFNFSVHTMTVTITDLVIHGKEPPGAPPLFRAPKIVIQLKPSFHKPLDIESLAVENPSANVIAFADGTTNIPSPKVKSTSGASGLQTVVDLAIGRIDVTGGSIDYLQQSIPLEVHGTDFHADLKFDPASSHYQGAIAMNAAARDVNARVEIPLVLGGDGLQILDARVTTPQSSVVLNASLQHLANPAVAASIDARISLIEAASAGIPLHPRPGLDTLTAAATVRISPQAALIENAAVVLGDSKITANGNLRAGAPFHADLSLDQLSDLFALSEAPSGKVLIAGSARIPLSIAGTIDAPALSFREVKSAKLHSAFRYQPQHASLTGLTLATLGGELRGDAHLDQPRFSLHAILTGFQIQTLARALASKSPGYSGAISGTLRAQGEISGRKTAEAHLAIAPGRSGVPVSGAINAAYDGNVVSLNQSHIGLPSSRIAFSGTIGESAQIHVISRNLSDFYPALELFSANRPPLVLKGGTGALLVQEQGPLAKPDLSGQLSLTGFALGDRVFDRVSAGFHASPSGASVRDGVIARGNSQARFSGSVALRQWKPDPRGALAARLTAQNTDLGDFAALAGSDVKAAGTLNANVDIGGTIGDPVGTVQIAAANGSVYGQPFDRARIEANLSDRKVDLTALEAVAGQATLNARGSFVHPADSFSTGRIQANVATDQIRLDQLQGIQQRRPGLAGIVSANADVVGELTRQRTFIPAAVNATIKAQGIRDGKQQIGDLTLIASTYGPAVNTRLDSDFTGSKIQLTARTELKNGYPTSGNASIRSLNIEKAAAVFTPARLPATGTISADADFSGTVDNPQIRAGFALTNAVLYEEPVRRAEGQAIYSKRLIELKNLRVSGPAGAVEMSASLNSPSGLLGGGRAEARISSAGIEIGQVRRIQQMRPGIAGTVRLEANVSADLRKTNGRQEVLPLTASIDGGVTGLRFHREPLGNLTIKGNTRGGEFSANLDANIVNSQIHATASARLGGDYPGSAHVMLANFRYSDLHEVVGTEAPFDALVAGEASFTGAFKNPESGRAEIAISQLEFTSAPRTGAMVTVKNDGPLRARLERETIAIERARLTGPSTNIDLAGTVGLANRRPLNVTFTANANLDLIKKFYPDAYSGGSLDVDTTIRGTVAQPLVNGRVELKDASLQLAEWPNGISNANGVILLDGRNARISSLTAESGGGKITVDGFAGFTGAMFDFDLKAGARQVRTRFSGASVTTDASLTFSGTSQRSILGGSVSITRVGYSQQSDIGALLSGAATPPGSPSTPGVAARTRLHVKVQTAPGVRFRTSIAQEVSANADLTLLGTLQSPGLVGRVDVTSGELLFFGNKYTVNRGSIGFYSATNIQPVLDVDLLTTVQGVNVDLGVTGPIDNLKLSYRSDPPLKFEDIVALLATGKTPPDPTIAVNQPYAPEQTAAQMGESAILGQAVADPIANRLQRVFGVTQLKIAPTFVTGSTLPQARITLTQQVSSALTFTYSQDLTQASSQLIRVTWTFSPRFSAVATRDENGILGVDFYYKRQFR